MKIRVSLKATFIAVSIMCLLMSPIAIELKRAQRKMMAINKVQENHGYVTLDHEADGTNSFWRALLGRAFLANVHDVAFYSEKTLQGRVDSHEDMRVELDEGIVETLAEFSRCKELYLSDTTISCTDLRHLEVLNELSVLSLQRTSVDDSCISSLSKLKHLKTLFIDQTNISGEGALKLKELLPNTKIWHEEFLKAPRKG